MNIILFISVTVLMFVLFWSNQEAMAKSSKMKFDSYSDAIEFKHKIDKQNTKTTDGEVQLLGLCSSKDEFEDINSFDDAAKIPLSGKLNYINNWPFNWMD